MYTRRNTRRSANDKSFRAASRRYARRIMAGDDDLDQDVDLVEDQDLDLDFDDAELDNEDVILDDDLDLDLGDGEEDWEDEDLDLDFDDEDLDDDLDDDEDDDECAGDECNDDDDLRNDIKTSASRFSSIRRRTSSRRRASDDDCCDKEPFGVDGNEERLFTPAKTARRSVASRRTASDDKIGPCKIHIGNEAQGGDPSVSTLKNIIARLDKIASYAENHGEKDLAKDIDVITNTIEQEI